MSEVTLRIGGRTYRVACNDGQEAQLAKLGSMIDEKFQQLSGNLAPTEAQNLVFAAILLADELQEAREAVGGDPAKLAAQIKTLEAEVKSATNAQRETALELEAVRAERDTIANDLANIKSATSGQEPLFGSTGGADGADIAPKLEQLAELVEKCANSLESRLTAT